MILDRAKLARMIPRFREVVKSLIGEANVTDNELTGLDILETFDQIQQRLAILEQYFKVGRPQILTPTQREEDD